MCDFTAISLAIGVARTIGGAIQQQRQYKAQERAAAQRRDALRRQAINRYDEIAIERDRKRAAASEALEDNRRQSLRARENARVRGGEAGSAGLSLQGLVRDLGAQEGRFAERVRDGDRFSSPQLGVRAQGQELQTSLSLQSVSDPTPPDLLGAASSAFSGLGRLSRRLS